MGNNFSSKYELFRNVKADDKKGLNKNYGIFLVLRRKTGRKNNGYKSPPAISSMPKPKKPQGRVSLLAKLHKKQAEIAQRSVKKERQAVAENDMEREQK